MFKQNALFTPDQKEDVLNELKRRSRTLRLLRSDDSMLDLSLMVTNAAALFGADDPRFIETREAIKQSKVIKVILEKITGTLIEVPSETAREQACAIFKTFYPESTATTQAAILRQAEQKLVEVMNKTDTRKH